MFIFALVFALISCSEGFTLLGAIYGAEGNFCDAFYWINPHCSSSPSECSIPLSNEICTYNGTNYGKPNSKDSINVLHLNWECDRSSFHSMDVLKGQSDKALIGCPENEEATPGTFEKTPVVAMSTSGILDLGVVIGSSGIYCDAYFKTAPLCQGKRVCEIPINNTICSIGQPNPDETNNFIHIMYSCSGNTFNRQSLAQRNKIATIICP